MSRIIRTQPSAILSRAVEHHGFVYLAGITARDDTQDVSAQTADILAQIDELLEIHGTDNTQLLTAQVWLKDIRDRDAVNKLWTAWLPEGLAPVRACVEANMASPRCLVEIMVTACK